MTSATAGSARTARQPSAPIIATTFFFVRHGESENNSRELVNGWTDCALTERGREQARRAAACLSGCNIAMIYCSALARARETALIIAEQTDARVEAVEALKERNWGALEGQPRARLTDYFMEPEGGEGWEAYRARVWAALTKLALPERALIVGHAGTMRVLRHAFVIGDVTDRLPNAAPVRFHFDDAGRWSVQPVGR